MSLRTRNILVFALAAAVTTLTACSTTAKPPKPMTASPASVTVSTSPSAAPSTTAPTSSPPSTAAAPKGPDGTITLDQLLAHKVRIPAWTADASIAKLCPHGSQQLHRGTMTNINHDTNFVLLHVYKVVATNLDNDTANETAALITCQYGEAATAQVVAFDRDSGGHIVTRGTIAHGFIWNVAARSGGGVTIDISDLEACCSTPKALELHQTRSYAWQSGRYTQVAGAISFVPHTKQIDISVKLVSTTWSARENDHRTGTFVLKITNNSAYSSGKILVSDEDDANLSLFLPALAAHSSRTVTVKIVHDDDGYVYPSDARTVVSVNEHGAGAVGGDANPLNNYVGVRLW